MAFEADELIAEEQSPRRRRFPFTWPLLLAAGWVLYEVTTQPSLAILTICLKFGWNDFRTAYWLRRTDPSRKRGRAYFWLYLGSGFWRTAITAIVPMFAAVVLTAQAGPPQKGQQAGPPPAEFTIAFGASSASFLLSSLATSVAVWKSLRFKIPLWL